MKKILLILFLILDLFSNDTQAQTMDQTIQWLKSKTASIPLFISSLYLLRPINNDVELMYPQSSYNNSAGGNGTRIKFSQITNVRYSETEKGITISLSGTTNRVSNGGGYLTDIKQWDTLEYEAGPDFMQITYAVSEDEIKKIKKAYEHLAKLCGAKLVSDDLFKN